MKLFQFSFIALITISLTLSSCSEVINPLPDNHTNDADSVSSESVTYEATGRFIFTSTDTSTPKSFSHQYVKIQYKDVSNIWTNTYYTYLTFYNTNRTAAAEMLTFVFLGKELPKTGTYKIGPNIISMNGISETDKILPGEVSIQAVGNGQVTKREAEMTVNVVNNNGHITITSNHEINVYNNITGELKGTCKNINLTRTTKKL